MSNSELIAYNYGKRLADNAIRLAQEGRPGDMPEAAIMDPTEAAALERLGRDKWWSLVLRGGQEILGEPDVVPPLQT